MKRQVREINTFYTKCNRQFKKSSAAVVTGYNIDLREEGTISEVYQILKKEAFEALIECVQCPFKVKVTEGYPPVFKHWECRAGSLPPNHTTDWTGSLDDKNTISINSLDNSFMESIIEYCKDQPDISASYNADHLADCRRTLSISCSSNKKGIAAKKALIEKFFPAVEAAPEEMLENNDDELFDEQTCRVCGCTENNACEGGCYWVEDDLCSKCAENSCDEVGCPFNNGNGSCCFKDEDPDSDGYHRDVIDAVEGFKCKKEDVLLAYKIIERPDSFDIPYEECGTCLNCGANKDECDAYQACKAGGLDPEKCACEDWRQPLISQEQEASACGTDESLTNTGSGSCASGMEETGATSTVDKPIATIAEGSSVEKKKEVDEVISESQKCKYGKSDCLCYCNHNEGCSVLLIRGGALRDWVEEHSIDCDVFRSVRTKVLGENTEETALDAPASNNVQSFDYSTVDTDTAEFLHKKVDNIREISKKALTDIGQELKEAQDKLAKHGYGCFEAWYTSLGYDRNQVYRLINRYELILSNRDNQNLIESLPTSLINEIAKPSAPAELKQQVISGDITTHKQYKELEEKLRAAERKAEKTLNLKYEADDKAIKAEQELKKAKKEKDDALRAYEKNLNNLNQQLDQVKRNGHQAKAQELGKVISGKQHEIEELSEALKSANSQVTALTQDKNVLVNHLHELTDDKKDLMKQLHEKPIEVAAARVVEKEVIPDEIANAIYDKVAKLYEGLLKLTEKEIQVFAANVSPDYYEEVVQGISDAIGVLNNIDSAVYEAQNTNAAAKEDAAASEPEDHCGDCKLADMDGVTPEQLNDENKTLCTVTGQVVDFEHSCGKYQKFGG